MILTLELRSKCDQFDHEHIYAAPPHTQRKMLLLVRLLLYATQSQ